MHVPNRVALFWDRHATEAELAAVLSAGPTVAAWNGEELVGFVRALSDGHLAAYIEDVMVHERCRHLGVGSVLMARLLEELEDVAVVNLFCAPSTTPFYEGQGFRRSDSVLLKRGRHERPDEEIVDERHRHVVLAGGSTADPDGASVRFLTGRRRLGE